MSTHRFSRNRGFSAIVISTVCERQDQIARIELRVARPIARGRCGNLDDRFLVSRGLEYGNQVQTVELAIQIRIAEMNECLWSVIIE